MSIAIPRWLVPWLIGVELAGVALTLIVAIRAYVRLRRGEYYVIRKEALRTALRASLAVLLLILLTVVSLFIPRRTDAPQPTPTATLVQVNTPAATRATPIVMPTATHTPQATATEPFIPTSTPQATLPVSFTLPLPSAIPPPGDARFEFWALAQGVDASNQPVEVTTQFPEGSERVYLFFRYDGLLPDVSWATVWYLNGEYLSGGLRLWEFEESAGERYEFLEFSGGFPTGEYEVQIWLGSRLQIRAIFSVVPSGG